MEVTGINNKIFWNELCGTGLFKSLGLTEINKESLDIFDRWYMNYYPYLYKYLDLEKRKNENVLEIGLGYGTVGELLFKNSYSYTGLDYSENPVKMMNDRILMNGLEAKAKALCGDARSLPFKNEMFDCVVSIGCLHHTGDTHKAVLEVYRVLKKNGTAIIMLYHKHSFRQLVSNPYRFFIQKKSKGYKDYEEYTRASYDANSKGEAAPVIDYYSKSEVKAMFKIFSRTAIHPENFDAYRYFPREKFLSNIAKIIGLDLYIVAKK